ncbi:MAG TPA: aminoacyl-tRNA hydrolase, partial [Acholeplasmataceae bacterium]|nr:aminoacyl-tRNA hydrolase [Acholeplasmataceae bacterium]
MKLVVGLGNPGRRYNNTRHNTGFMFVDKVSDAFKVKFKLDKAKRSKICEFNIDGEKIILIKPQTYMNNSGEAVLACRNFYKIPIENILVIYDDLDLDVAQMKIKPAGSSGGHKGMQSIIDYLKTTDIKRVRIGISK